MKILTDLLRGLWPTVPMTRIEEPESEPEPGDPLVAAGEAALAEAIRLWGQDIIDPKPGDKTARGVRSRAVIQDIASSPLGGALTNHVYHGDGRGVQWCTLFWARCWGDLLHLTPAERANDCPSTYRLHELLNERSIFGVPNPLAGRDHGWKRWTFDAADAELPDGCEPRAGDLLIVGDGNPRWGDHGTMVRHYDPATRMFHTIEGNASGYGPKGDRRQGIVKETRPLGKRRGETYHALALIRPGLA